MQDIVVNYSTGGGTATPNVDYQRVVMRSLLIPAGATSGTIPIASVVKVHLVDSNGGSYDVGEEDVRVVPFGNFKQITFRLPDQLADGLCNIKIRERDQESNTGTMRITN